MADALDSGRKLRVKERKLYIDQDLDDDDIEGKRNYGVDEKLTSDKYNKRFVQHLTGEDFNLKYLQENGLENPILFKEKSGLGLRVPSENFKVSDVKACVGSRRMLDVMDVTTQKGMEMTMKEWVKYYETPERERLLNVISLEFSHTKLENYVESPSLVRQVDWVDTAWPQHLKDCQTEATNVIDKMKYPKVQKYCLMSVEGCYTDFHIDFGGTSVWYHLLHGEKVFWLIPPTEKNISMYENWVLSGKQGDAFLADTIGDCCERVTLVSGNTFIIPSGWIHAVYTPKDSLVFGGNFLHNFNIVNQLRASAMEDKTHVPTKFRYPFYTEISWYVLERYVHCLTGYTYLEKPQLNEDMELNSLSDKDAISPELAQNDESKRDAMRVDDDINTPKLAKKVSVSLTRIDGNSSQSPRRKSSSDEDSVSFSQMGLIRQSSSDSTNSCDIDIGKPGVNKPTMNEKSETGKTSDRRPMKKIKYVHLTRYEYEGLAKMVEWLDGLPKTKKNIPSDLLQPETVIREMKRLLKEHANDDPDLAATGEPVLVWTKATKKLIKYKQKVKTAKLLGVAPPGKGKLLGKKAGGSLYRRVRCKKCEPCTRDDCMECNFCKDMKKYGGPGRAKQSCISRQCLRPILPHSATCLVCKEARHTKDEPGETHSTLMECSFCWDVVHPDCLARKLEDITEEGIVNEDLPSSWKCIRCCHDGKEGPLKARVFKGGWRPTPTSSPPPQGYTSDESVTEGKRVTNKPNPDYKKSPSNPTSPLSLPSPQSQDGDRDVKPSAFKHEPTTSPDRLPATGIVKSTKMPNSPPQSDIKSEPIERSMSPVVRLSHSMPLAKSVTNEQGDGHRIGSSKSELVKRRMSSGPVQTATAIKKRRLSLTSSPKKSPSTKLTKTPKPVITRSGRTVNKSPAIKNHKGASPELTKRSRREADYDECASAPYDFEDSSMDYDLVSTPLTAKGKGKKFGKKVGRKGSLVPIVSNGQGLKNDNSQNPFHSKILPRKFSSVKKKDENVANPQVVAKKEFKLVEPKFVIRPAPPSPPQEHVYLDSGKKHQLPTGLWTRIFTYLSPADLARCLSVCRVWNRWCINPELWKVINLSRHRIVQTHLMGITRRQPISLVLTSVIMTQKQLAWVVERIPHLKTLILSKCAWATMSGLCSSVCPLLHSLDISWAAGVSEQCFEDLITPPVDSKPAVKPMSRLHRLKYLNLAGTEVTDDSLNLINVHILRLEVLDISYCARITDKGIQILANQNAPSQESLRVLNVSSCRQLTEASLDAMKNLKNLHHLNIKGCMKIPAENCNAFVLPGHTFAGNPQFIW